MVHRARTIDTNTANNNYNPSLLASTSPTDFVGRSGAIFDFGLDRKDAGHYCKYAKRRQAFVQKLKSQYCWATDLGPRRGKRRQ